MSLLRLFGLFRPAHFADWYRIGAEYVQHVSEGMGFPVGDFPLRAEEATAALRAGRTDVSPEVARSIAADLLADATFSAPYLEWMPLWYELALVGPVSYAEFRLRRVAGRYTRDLDHVTVPRFSRPGDVLVGGRPAMEYVSGFAKRFVLADAVLHLEWFTHVARESGIRVPDRLVERTREETVAYYTGNGDLSDDTRHFQRLLFADDEWVRDIDAAYDLDSTLFGVWERILSRERERL
ncbi:hypothetical protein [Salinigranum marinum]|uniref:hypothetical protein n=1 Tax=Salinigranum marinum TaxID=1515595 RepID=UPI002989A55E|nr:hypothetical protein [Salinigranum marinum]